MKLSPRIFSLLLFMLGSASVNAALSEHDILREADQARGNVDGISWEVAVQSKEQTRTQDMLLEVNARGFDIHATTLAPAKNKGNQLLMLKGHMWFYRPGLSKPVPISKRQKLMGNAAYGDITSTDYANNYTATLIGEEAIDGELCYRFHLKSLDKNATYDAIDYWVSKRRLVGVKADYFTVSGKRFKTARMDYGNRVVIDGKSRSFISSTTITDELLTSDVTTLRFGKTHVDSLPDSIFNLNLMRK